MAKSSIAAVGPRMSRETEGGRSWQRGRRKVTFSRRTMHQSPLESSTSVSQPPPPLVIPWGFPPSQPILSV